MDMNTGMLFAVKRIRFDPGNLAQSTIISDLQSEIEILSKLDHPQIVRYLGSEQVLDNFCIYLEYMPSGSISTIMDKHGAMLEETVQIYAKQIIDGLAYLHKQKVIHRDIKAANLLVDSEGTVKLADFGCSKRLESSYSHNDLLMSLKGSIPWMAPEVIKQSGHGRKADIWSVG